MAHPSVIAMFRERVEADFTACPIYPENSFAEQPTDGGPYIVVQFPYTSSRWIASDEFEEEGAALFVLHLRLGAGADRGREWLEEIAALFRGKLIDGVQCFAPDSPVADDRNDVPGRYKLSLAVPYLTTIEG